MNHYYSERLQTYILPNAAHGTTTTHLTRLQHMGAMPTSRQTFLSQGNWSWNYVRACTHSLRPRTQCCGRRALLIRIATIMWAADVNALHSQLHAVATFAMIELLRNRTLHLCITGSQNLFHSDHRAPAVESQNHRITESQNRRITESQDRRIAESLRRCVGGSLRRCIATSLHH